MEAHELAERFKKQEVSHEEIVMWCRENVKNIDFKDENQSFLYEVAVRYLMNDKIGKWNRDDAEFIIIYFSMPMVDSTKTTVAVLGEDEYRKNHPNDSNAICVTRSDGTFKIDYSSRVVDRLLSNDYDEFLRGMQTIFHEPIHALQEIAMRGQTNGRSQILTKSMYIMALETLARNVDPEFYSQHYAYLFKENQAERVGLQYAIEKIKRYSPKLSSVYNSATGKEAISQQLQEYERTFFDKRITIKSGREVPFLKWVQALSSKYVGLHPEVLMRYPGLQVGYNLDGTQKDLSQLISERDDMISKGEQPLEKIDELYDVIINYRVILGKNLTSDVAFLEDYISRTGTDDEFIFSVLEARLRMFKKITPEQISEFMQEQYNIAAKVRQDRDLLEAKTEEKLEDDLWTKRFQSWEEDATRMPNVVKTQADIVGEMHLASHPEKQIKITEDDRGNESERNI